MIPFVTEFPIRQITSAEFTAQVIGWLRGSSYSTVLDEYSVGDLSKDAADLRSRSGEELHLRHLRVSGVNKAVGFRHDNPDADRVWRTEAVVSFGDDSQTAIVRIRTQCLAKSQGARLQTPKKPYFVKAILQDGWGATDGALPIGDEPIWLDDNDIGLLIAGETVLGSASSGLPVVYVSAIGAARWTLSRTEIERLAYDLGGVAHVVVEPSRSFSFSLRDQTSGKNAYGGSISISLPSRGIVKRFNFGWLFQDSTDLMSAVKDAALGYGSYIPARGWDWTELQEQALRYQRESERSKLTADEVEELYRGEIVSLQQRISELQAQLSATVSTEPTSESDDFPAGEIQKLVGPEIYRGELVDRLHLAARLALRFSDQVGLDDRSLFVLEEINRKLPWSPSLSHLEEGIRRACKDPKRLASEVTSLLSKHGYHHKADNKHVRLEANEGYGGLGAITLPKTPSESRGLNNQRSQMERTLGLTTLRSL